MDCLIRFYRRCMFSFKSTIGVVSLKGYIFSRVSGPFFQMLFFCTIAKHVYGSNNVAPWIIGNALILCYFSTFFGVGVIFRAERFQGTLKTIIVSPTSTIMAVIPGVLKQVFESLTAVGIGFMIGILFFDFRLPFDALLPFALVIVLSIFSAMGFGLIVGSIALLTRDANMLINICAMFLMAFSGANFHISKLPINLQWISYCLPLTRGIQLMRHIERGDVLSSHTNLLIQEIIIGIIFFIIGFVIFGFIERLAQKHATFDVY